jgi:hypothetical protein
VRLPISDGIDPVRELLRKFRNAMAIRLPISDGMDPVRELEAPDSPVIAVRLPICDGMDPMRELVQYRRGEVPNKSRNCKVVY